MTHSARALLTDLIDYAGLFPPAKLEMQPAAEEYNRCRLGEHEWMLGRFLCPVTRLTEFERAATALMPGSAATSGYREMADAGEPWRLSVLIDPGPGADLSPALDLIERFNARHADERNGLAEIDVCELKPASLDDIDPLLDQMPEGLYPFIEMPSGVDPRGFAAALSGSACAAKIRTGGVRADAFPTVAEVAEFLHACAAADVPFKATAGLHHPLRSQHPMTYEAGSATCVMHGFLNLFVAAALVRAKRVDPHVTQQVLRSEDPRQFRFSDQVVGWNDHMLETAQLAKVRESFALGFGSCSFGEPVEDLRALGIIA
jgi:hypothetical protein